MSQNKKTALQHKALYIAVATALASSNAYAACSGSIASPNSAAITVLCNGTGTAGNLNVTDSTSFNDSTTTATAGNNTLLQFDGQGRTLTNTGSIINDRVITGTSGARGRTAILMGAATQNAAVFGATAPISGATSINTPNATAAWVGQTVVVGRYDPVEGDMFNGNVRIITAVSGSGATATVTLDSPLDAEFDPGVSLGSEMRFKVISNYGGGDDIVNNSGTISSQILAAEITGNKTGASPTITSVSYAAAVKAITASVEGDYIINNAAGGIISAKHDGIGSALGIEEGGAVTSMTINNDGLISAERTAHLTLVDILATGNPTATSTDFAGYTKQTVANVNAINTQEEAEEIIINNSSTGIIRAKGDYSGTIYMRAAEKTIVNDGLIEHLSTDGNYDKGFAIAAVSDPGSIRSLELDNSATGTIKGDILVVNGNALRWYLLSTEGTLDNRLNINSQYGQSDSVITNAGQIIGNLYFSNGTHELTNEQGATITGNIDIDQRNTFDVAGNGTLLGTKRFTFENAGNYTGNITVRTANGSNVTLIPTITGSGVGTTIDTPSSNIAGMGGTLKVYDGTAAVDGSNSTANLVTVAPKAATLVHMGEWFKVANTLYGDTLPDISSENTPLVTWGIAKNSLGNLVIGVDSVASAANLGIRGQGATALNALMAYSGTDAGINTLGAILQNMSSVDDIENASEQLRPEINGANIQAAMGVTDRVFGLVDSHLGETHLASLTGKSGVATGEQPNGTGVWLQGFGFRGDQDKRKGVDGYTADAYGFAFGADTLIGTGNLRVGGAFSYGQSNIDDKGVNNGNTTDIDSYQATLYGSMLMSGWYLNGTLGLGKHDYDSKRIVLNNVVKGNHDAWQYTAKVDAGWPLKVGAATMTPVASLTYSRLEQDGYSENGIGALRIKGNDTDSFRSGLGAKASIPLHEGAVNAGLELRAIWQHEFADTAQDTTAGFVGGGSSFTTSGVDTARDSANLGASVRLSGGDKDVQQSLLLSYDAEIKNQYLSHTALLQARFDF